MRRAALLLTVLVLPSLALAETRVGLRVGDHAGHGRVVLDWPGRAEYRVEEEPGRVVLRFAAPAAIAVESVRRMPRNVAGLAPVEGGFAISTAPGVRVRHFRLDNRIVVDLLDPVAPVPVVAGGPTPRALDARVAAAEPPLATAGSGGGGPRATSTAAVARTSQTTPPRAPSRQPPPRPNRSHPRHLPRRAPRP